MAKKKPEKSLDELLEEALVKEDEQPYEVPGNWEWVRIGSINLRRSVNIDPSKFSSEKFELYGVTSFASGFPEALKGKEIKSTKQAVQKGDILLCKINPRINRVWIVGNSKHRTIGSSEWIVITPPDELAGEYLLWVLRTNYFRNLLTSNVSGVGGSLTRARPKDVAQYPIPYPPLPEQNRIVKKLSSTLGRLKEARELIQEARDTLEERRAAILNKAFTGELTRKWREENPDVESAEKLLERIQKRRKITYDADCKKAKNEGKRKPRKLLPDKIPEINYGIRIEIPNSWTYTNVDFLAHVTKLAGFEYTKYINFSDTGEISIVRAQNVHMGEFIENNITYIDKKTSDFLVRSQLNEREVLMVFIGAGTGNVCMAPKGRRWHLGPNVAKIDVDEISAECINYYLQSHVGLANMRLFIKATAQPSLSMATIRKILVNLPPLQEQKEIVRILRKLLDHEDVARALLDMEEQIDLLEKSILSKAFRGELGTNDPDDEPATELLKRSLKEKSKVS